MALNKGEKLVKLDICFKLPADFKGDLNDALQALLDYRRGPKNHKDVFKMDPEATSYDNWWKMVQETDRPFCGKVSISEYDGEKFNPMSL